MARWQQATSWFSPELLTIPLDVVRGWMADTPALAVYQFAIEEVYRLQEHVLDERGERLLSLSARLSGAPGDAYLALSTADARFPDVTLSTGEAVTMSYGQYRAVLATNRHQPDRRAAFLGHYGTYRREPEHLRVALPWRLPARLVLRPVSRVRHHARECAARQQHSAVGRRQSDRDDPRRRRSRCSVTIASGAAP